MLYPWFVEYQKCNDLVSHKKQSNYGFSKGSEPSAVWITAFDYLVGNKIHLYACDSEGSLYVFESGEGRVGAKQEDILDWRDTKDVKFEYIQAQSQTNIHKNGIIQVLIV